MSKERFSTLRNFAIVGGAVALAYEACRWASLIKVEEGDIKNLKTLEEGSRENARILTNQQGDRYVHIPSGATVECTIKGHNVFVQDFKRHEAKGRPGDVRIRVDHKGPQDISPKSEFEPIQHLSSAKIIYRNNNGDMKDVMKEEGITK